MFFGHKRVSGPVQVQGKCTTQAREYWKHSSLGASYSYMEHTVKGPLVLFECTWILLPKGSGHPRTLSCLRAGCRRHSHASGVHSLLRGQQNMDIPIVIRVSSMLNFCSVKSAHCHFLPIHCHMISCGLWLKLNTLIGYILENLTLTCLNTWGKICSESLVFLSLWRSGSIGLTGVLWTGLRAPRPCTHNDCF